MAMRHGVLPQTLHVDAPSSHVDWSEGAVELLTEQTEWPETGRARRAGVSSFGISGTNVHTIIEQAPRTTAPEPTAPRREPGAVPWLISGRTRDALRGQAARLLSYVQAQPELDLVDGAFSLATTRTRFDQRAAVVAGDRTALLRSLTALATDLPDAGVIEGEAARRGRTAMLFTGQGSQRPAMGRELYERFPAFAEALDTVCAELDPLLDRPLREVLFASEGTDEAALLDETGWTQPALFAVEVALFRLVRSWGVKPDFVAGHSIGELAAAHAAGVLSLADACALVAARAKLMQALPTGGAMVAVRATEDEVTPLLSGREDAVSIAAVNGPDSVVVSGDEDAVLEIAAAFDARGRKTKRLRVSHAFHSPRMAGMLDAFRTVAEGLTFHAPQIPLVSNPTGALATNEQVCSAEYWVAHVRDAVRFADCVRTLRDAGTTTFLELGPDGPLSAMAQDTLGDTYDAELIPLCRADRGEELAVTTALARLQVQGVTVDWPAYFAGSGARRVDLPTYAFQHEFYWPQLPTAASAAASADPADQRLWAAVERGDADELAAILGLGEQEHGSLGSLLPALTSWRRGKQEKTLLDSLRYRVEWARLNKPAAPVLDGTWLLVTGDTDGASAEETDGPGALADQLAGALSAHGARVRRLALDASCADRHEVAARLEGTEDFDSTVNVLSLLPLDERPSDTYAPLSHGLTLTLALVQALHDTGSRGRLWTATSGAVSTGPADPVTHPVQAAAWGFGRTVALEHPRLWGGLVDLPDTLDERTAQRLAGVLAAKNAPDGEDQVALRASGVSGRRLVRYTVDALPAAEEFTARGTVLVTGGTGGLGAEVGRWLARSGAENLVLTSRRGPDAPGAAELRAELEELGARVEIVACDAADRDALAAVLAGIPAELPLTGVVHTAGVGQYGPLEQLAPAEFAELTSAKLAGAAHLDALLGDRELDLFVLFGSVAGVWGSGDQSAYGAANAYLDALAEHRRARGLAATSVAWGPWAEAGMATDEAVSGALKRQGLGFLEPGPAMTELRRAVVRRDVTVTVADVDWDRYAPVFTSARPSALFADLPEVRALDRAAGQDDTGSTSEFVTRVRALGEPEQARLLSDLVRSEAAAVLGHSSADGVPEGRAFRDIGFDSLTAVELRKRLSGVTGLTLPSTMVFDYPTPQELAQYLRAEILGAVLEVAGPVAGGAAPDEPIAIIGMSCRFPGGAGSPEQLWDLVTHGADAVTEFPVNRGWDAQGLFDPDPDRQGKTYSTLGGFLHEADAFDPTFFGISPREALVMDPQQRLLLETTWETFERAGINPTEARGSLTGTFIGSSYQDYGLGAGDGAEGHMVTGSIPSVLSGRISYVLGLEGPAVTVDTACSSSLVALHLACQSLRNGESTLAVAGGATIMTTPAPFIAFSRQRALAQDGRCKAFSDDADGMTLAEGVGILLVERLSDARRNGHPVLAVIRGSAINQDGASNGLTAPNGPSQQRVMRQALANARLAPSDIDVVEAHGTGTPLGDPIEAQALLATYGRDRDPEHSLLLGSVKSNIGHTQSAAGVAGVIKMVMALRHGRLPRTLHAENPSSHVDWSSGTVRLLHEAVEWPATGRPRRAAVSSFGISGTNAHTLLEQAPVADEPEETPPAVEPVPVAGGVVPWIVSARAGAALREQATRLVSHLENAGPAPSPLDLGFSLVSSRSVFEHRAVVVPTEDTDPLEALRAIGADGPSSVVARGVADIEGRTVFVFPGQGSQWVGMGARLLDESPVFAERIAECAAALSEFVDWSLVDVLRGAEGAPMLERVDVVQPASFAIMVSLAALWRSRGVEPAAVVGHSQGEIAAAVVSGALSLQDGARVVALRSQAIGRTLAGHGGMMSVALPVEQLESRLDAWSGRVSVAAVNGPRSVVVSGEPEALDELSAELTAEEIRVRRIAVDYASHSAQVENLHDELLGVLAPVTPRTADVPFFSTTTGDWLDTEQMDAGYWFRNLRRRVLFADAVRDLLSAGHRAFIEVSSHPVLTMTVQDMIDETAEPAVATGTLRRDQDSVSRFLLSAAEVFVRGVDVDWAGLFAGTAARRVDLPTYAFQHEQLWAIPPGAEPAVSADPVDAEFWAAVEQEDLSALTSALGTDESSVAAVLPALSSWRRSRKDRSTVDSWRYRVSWTPMGNVPQQPLTGTWLLVSADGHDTDEVADALSGQGAEVTRLVLDEACVDRAVLAGRLTGAGEVAGIVSTLAATEEPDERTPALTLGLALTVSLVQALGDAGIEAPLWFLTRGAVSTGRSDEVTSPAQALVTGVGWTTALEHPQRWGGVIDLPQVLDLRAAGRLVSALSGALGDEDQLAVRSSGVFTRRIVRAAADGQGLTRDWTPRGTTLITGGSGTLAPHLARWLAEQGAEHLVLMSRRGMDAPGAAELVAELAASGTEATVAACDVTDRDAVAALLACLKAEGRTVRTVVHTAALIELYSLAETTMDAFSRVLHAKVTGAQVLDELLDNDDLDDLILYSSTAGMWGSGAHAAYVAGNAYLAALAAHRRARGLRATSLSWGIWADDIKAGRIDPQMIRRSGLEFMDPQLALTGLKRALDDDETAIAVADVDWETYYPVFTSSRPTSLFAEVPEVRALTEAAEQTTGTVVEGEFTARLRALSAAERERLVLEVVRTEAMAVLGLSNPDALPDQRAFRDVGFDSLTAVGLRNRLASVTGLTLPTTMVFDYPSPAALAGFLRSELAGAQSAGTPAATASLSATDDDPIVIIGMGCRYPGGVTSPEELWKLALNGTDAVSGFPADRGWDAEGLYDPDPDRSGKTYSVQGGFLRDVAEFDPGFFGISPREAMSMDPQQRLLLETAWEAFEHAGIDIVSQRSSLTGTFIGASYQDYASSVANSSEGSEGHMITGTLSSVLSGRVNYLFGFEGPAVTLDTACSSSLVALHLACQSLRNGESSLALAGGVSIMSTPSAFVGFSRQRALATDGRCKAYAEAADGMTLAEGVGLVLLERLSEARRNGHTVLAVVRGSAVNQDGASNGLTAPNGPSQQRVIRQALANAGLQSREVDVIEGHGTGTALGDPIEAQALLTTYGQDRDAERPLLLGSVKSNIGHTQMASGVAGVIKMVHALREGVVPKTLHIDTPTSHVDWSSGAVDLLTEQTDWPETGRPRRGAVSSFGLSGTNVHTILEQAPADEPAPDREPRPGMLPLVVSARSEAALRAQAGRLLSLVEERPDTPLTDLAFSLATSRAGLERRAAVVAGERDELLRGLLALRDGLPGPGVLQGGTGRGRTAFLFTGQGSQRAGMGRELYERFPVFADALDAVLARVDGALDRPLREILFSAEGSPEAALLDRTEYAQPALFAIEVALFRLAGSWGITPDYLAGHSVGELAAAHVAGVLSLEDACALVVARGRLMQALPEGGAMISLQAAEDEVLPLLEGREDEVSVAAVNGPASLVIAGVEDTVLDIAATIGADGRKTTRLRVSHAFHSPLMDGMLDDFARVARAVTYHPPVIPFVSDVTGSLATDDQVCTPEYWVQHVRRAVRFADGINWLSAQGGVRTFLEIGPDGVLCGMARESLTDEPRIALLPLLRGGRPEEQAVTTALAGAYAHGVDVDWPAYFADSGARRIELPTYAFQRERYWPDTLAAAVPGPESAGSAADAEFWSAVERDDVGSLAVSLGLDDATVTAMVPALTAWRRRRDEQSEVDAWRYRVTWKPQTGSTAPTALTGRWLVLVPSRTEDAEWSADVVGALATETVTCEVTGSDRTALAGLLAGLRAEHGEFAGVLSLLGLAGCESVARTGVPDSLLLTAVAVQALGDAGIDAPLWAVTRGAVSVGRSEPVVGLDQAAVWGLGRVIALEQPGRWGGCVDLPEQLDTHTARRLRGVLAGTAGESEAAVRASGVFVRRLAHSPVAQSTGNVFDPSGTILITGGTGGLGGHVARGLARAGAEHLLLVSRRGEDAPGADALRTELTGLGARVTVAACDVADHDAVAALLGSVPEDTPLSAVIHTAGVVEDSVVDALTQDSFRTVLDAKVASARNLHELTAHLPLSAFVLFSSTAGVFGAAGQGNYAAANAYLDALAEYRRAHGQTALSVAWGPWAGSGMVADAAEIEMRVRRGGFEPLAPEPAVRALLRAIEQEDTALALADIDWTRFVPAFATARPLPLVGDLPEVRQLATVPSGATGGEPELRQRLVELPEAERGGFVLDLLRTQVAAVLGHSDPDAIEDARAFRDLGFDSLTTLELRNGLAAATGLSLPASLVYDQPTPREMADFLLAELLGSLPGPVAAPVATGRPFDDDPIAVVGISCRFPGGVSSPEELWQLLEEGRDGITRFPDDRGWDIEALGAGASDTLEGGFLTGVADFDARFFGISPREALAMDPQQRLLLEATWEALERAGIDPSALRGSTTGVFVGTNGQDYPNLLRRSVSDVRGYVATGNTASVMSGRLSYALGLEGPAVTVDTACSSSLVAMHWAGKALSAGECSLVIAGGVSVMASPDSFVEFSTQGGLAPDGRCKAFSDSADGTAWSEGVGILVLERLSDAVRNGHEVRGIIRSTAVNQDGASNGLTAPNGPSQQRVIRQALADAGLTAADIDAVEAHGTGTTLGDPIEAQALLTTYGRDRERPLLLGTVKSNIGHTQAAAGVAGVIKMLMAMRHGTLPKSLHIGTPSAHVDWTAGAVELLTEQTAWPETGRPRRAGVSAFGVSGTNAHVIVEQAPAAEPPQAEITEPAAAPTVVPWIVSGRTREALQAQIDRLTSFAALHPGLSPLDIGRSLATDRTVFPHRAVLLAGADGVRESARGVASRAPGRSAFLFSGQGSQRGAMGRELYERFPVFAEALDAVLAHLDTELEFPLREVLFAYPGTFESELLDETGWTQPALFAVEVALFRLAESWGITPDFVAGHSIGEITAAHVAGVFSLADACRLVAARATLMQALPQGGAMVALEATEDEVAPLLDADVSIAAVNGPRALVIAGAESAVLEVAELFAADGRRTRRLRVSHAFHSPLMDPMLADFARVTEGLAFEEPRIPVVSNLTGALATADELRSPAYWVRHAREAVRFADGVRTLQETGVGTFVELGPDGVLSAMAQQSLDGVEPAPAVVPLLRKDQSEEAAVVAALAALHTHGAGPRWSAFFEGLGAHRVELPTYAFQRERYWPETAAFAAVGAPDPVDAEFWSAVEREDLESLAASLDLDGDTVTTMVPALSAWRRRRGEQSAGAGWRYHETWTPLSARPATAPSGDWLVLLPAGDASPWMSAAVAALGTGAVRVETVRVETGAAGHAERVEQLAAARADRDGTGWTGVVSLLAAATTDAADLPPDHAWPDALLTVLGEAGIDAPLWCVTRGAVSVSSSEPLLAAGQAAVWGQGRVTALEHADRWGGLIDVPGTIDDRTGAALAAALTDRDGRDGEDQIAVRATGTLGRRLVRTTTTAANPAGNAWRPTGTVLVTGGTGTMGGRAARWLAREGAQHLVLTGRHASDLAGSDALEAELKQLGATVTLAVCEVSDHDALTALLAALPEDTPLTAVIHAEVDTNGIGSGSAGLAAALAGAVQLDTVLGDRPLDAFVLFGTIAGVWGVRGQEAPAALGAYLDALARQRRDRGATALAVSWSAWSDLVDNAMAAHLRMNGLPVLDADAALAALGRAVADGEAAVTVADVRWETFAPAFTEGRRGALLADLPEARKAIDAADRDRGDERSAAGAYRQRLLELPEAERDEALLALVTDKVAVVLGHTNTDVVESDLPFRDLGFDSLTAVDLRNQLTADTGVTLPATLVFDHPTPAGLARHLRSLLLGELPDATAPVVASAHTGDDPVVIVGMACRYPGGVGSPEDLWQLVLDETDAVGEFPTDRGWDLDTLLGGPPEGGRGRSTTGNGGFLYDAADFDPAVFGISPREAIVMDPQQRIVLEAAWEALERAGIDASTLRGSTTGVYVGGGSGDYRPPAEAGQWETAQSASLLSGRIAYSFGLQGPTVSVDTACSSSLVALHLAAQALRSGECSIALAGGVTVMATPAGFVEFSAQGALSSDGRCKAFSEGADGTGWSEGVGMLVVERLSDARRNRHHILAVLRGSAINQDGASNGLTAPSGPAQQRVIRQALANSGLTTAEVDAIEAHGTGTKLGDPIEAQALLATYGQDRDPERPVLLGSLKSNIGHSQAASGVAGVIKMVMAMRHGTLPRSLYAETPTSQVDWTAGAVQLLAEPVAWPESGHPRRAGVSSFGASGTNAHVILEQAPPAEAEPAVTAPDELPREAATLPVLLSGKSENALRAQARGLLAQVTARPDTSLTDLAFSLATTRTVFDHRAALTATGRDGLLEGLTALAEGGTAPDLVEHQVERTGKRAFLFSGQGSQRLGMCRELYGRFPVFTEALDAVFAVLDPLLDRPLREVMWGDDAELLNETGFTQPALFAVEVALFRLVESWGVKPDFVAGHSIGEIAAAHVAGVFSLEDAARLVVARASLMQALPAGGAMVAVQATEGEVLPLLSGEVSIAAVNGVSSVVISGAEQSVLEVGARLAEQGRRTSRLRVSHAFHSPLMAPMLDAFRTVAESLSFGAPRIAVVSNLTGGPASAEELCSPEYWVRHVREAVRFADGVRTMADRGVTTFLELGPDGVLSAMAQETAPQGAVVVPVLRKDRDEETTLVTALARLHVHGVSPRWPAFFAGTGAQWLDLPTYAFQRGRFWPDVMPGVTPAGGAAQESETTDRAFWDAVEQKDFVSLESTLDVEGDALSKVLPALLDWRRQQYDESVMEGWRHRIVWKALTGGATANRKPLTGTWLVVVPAESTEDAWVSAALDALGTKVVRVAVDSPDRAALAGELRARAEDGTRFAGVLSLLALRETVPGSVPEGVALTAVLLQALGDAGIEAPLWCATRGAVSVNRADRVDHPLQAAVWGLGRVAALEYPERWGGLIDLPETLDERTAAGFAGALAGLDGEDQIAVRTSAVLARRLVQAPGKRPARAWDPKGTVLITGGTGALGSQVARRLAKDGVQHLVLLSRSGPAAPGADTLRAELDGLGTTVTVAACDVADRAQLAGVLADIPAEHPLTGVVHAAGVLDDGVLDRLTPERFAAVFRSKVTSALLLDELTRGLDLTAFVLFSSASAAVGNLGQANYAAANSVLDALAERRRAQDLPATSVAWGAWDGGGMAEGAGADEAAKRAGVGAMDPELACETMLRLVMEPEPTAVVAEVALDRFVAAFGTARPSALLREFPGYDRMVAATAAPANSVAEGGLRYRLAALSANRRLETVVDLVRTQAAQVLSYPDRDAVGAERSFRDLGVDSLGAVELRNQLNTATGLSLSATLVFDHPTPTSLGEHVLGQLIPEDGAGADGEEAEIRALLASVPLAQLRDIGVLEPLLQLAGRGEAAPAEDDTSDESIDSMAVADLVRAALNGQSDL
ncbi:type I polyketide synthase [Streptomyces sp. NPDC004647]|uniref:type I polyketide synthase n=1 Tax=Streptomyces sp. NPDC004647 TaxID=3154671 RepID=UPI0033B70E1E